MKNLNNIKISNTILYLKTDAEINAIDPYEITWIIKNINKNAIINLYHYDAKIQKGQTIASIQGTLLDIESNVHSFVSQINDYIMYCELGKKISNSLKSKTEFIIDNNDISNGKNIIGIYQICKEIKNNNLSTISELSNLYFSKYAISNFKTLKKAICTASNVGPNNSNLAIQIDDIHKYISEIEKIVNISNDDQNTISSIHFIINITLEKLNMINHLIGKIKSKNPGKCKFILSIQLNDIPKCISLLTNEQNFDGYIINKSNISEINQEARIKSEYIIL